jgi:phosphate transport system substrate-binding protein
MWIECAARDARKEEPGVTISAPKRLGALVLGAAFVFAACGSGDTPSPSSAASSAPGESPSASDGSGMTLPAPPTGDVTLLGSGATFPAPLYNQWVETYGQVYPNIKIDYQAIGSGGGIKAITEQTVDFGASDAPMKDEEIAALPAGTTVLHVPMALGAVVVIYNVPGVTDLQLDDANLAGLFLGTIKTWDDPAIAANNPDVSLPATPVTIVHRSDGSGTTNAFTTFLDTVSPEWSAAVGKGKEVNWPTGIGAQGNDGVAGGVKQTDGSVGYVELNYAEQTGLTSANVKNADGNFVAGSTAGVTAAADAAAPDFPADFRQAPIINGAGPDTYPIASYTYLLVDRDQKDATKGQALVAYMAWCLTEGQSAEEALGYAPLPGAVQQKSLDLLHTITSGGSPIWP